MGGVAAFSILKNNYAAGGVEILPKINYSPSTTFSAEFQGSLKQGIVKIVSYQNFSSLSSVLDKAVAANGAISYGFVASSDGWVVASLLPASPSQGGPKGFFSVISSDGETFTPQQIVKDNFLGLTFLKISGASFKVLPLDGEHALAFGDDLFIVEGEKVIKSNLAYFGYPERVKKSDFVLSSENVNKYLFLKDKIGDEWAGLPIFSKKGEAVGVVNNQNLVVPIGLVKTQLKNFWKNGLLARPYFGVKYFDLSASPIKIDNINLKKGAYIFKPNELDSVIKNSPAFKAGIKPGDIILSVMGEEINEKYNLAERIGEYALGETIDLEISRNGETINASVILGSKE